MEKKIDIGAELERIKRDINDMEEAGIKQTFLNFFPGAENERAFIFAASAYLKSRGYSGEFEYEDNELLLIVRKAA